MNALEQQMKTIEDGLKEKTAAFNALLQKPDLADADLDSMEGIKKEMTALKAKAERMGEMARSAADVTSIESWMNTPALRVPIGGGGENDRLGEGDLGNGVKVLGMNRTGSVHIERTDTGYIEQFVDKNYSVGAFKASRSQEYSNAWMKHIRSRNPVYTNEEAKILQEGLDIEGGYLSPAEIENYLIQRKPTPTRVQNFVSRLTIGRDSVRIPKVNYTGPSDDTTASLFTTGMRVTWTGELPASATASNVTDPTFGQIMIPVYTAMLQIPVTRDLLEDSMIDLQGWLQGKFGETAELLRDQMILSGTGVNQPSGILINPNATNNPATVVSGAASTLTGDGIISLTESLPEQYDENARLVFNKTNTGQAIRKLKDGDGRPLFNYGAQDNGYGSPKATEINGYPYSWSGFMPNVAANAFPIIFGDFKGYTLVERVGLSVVALHEILAQSNQVLLLGRLRFGGMTTEEWRLKIQKVST